MGKVFQKQADPVKTKVVAHSATTVRPRTFGHSDGPDDLVAFNRVADNRAVECLQTKVTDSSAAIRCQKKYIVQRTPTNPGFSEKSGIIEIDLAHPESPASLARLTRAPTGPAGVIQRAFTVAPVEKSGFVTDFKIRGRPFIKKLVQAIDEVLITKYPEAYAEEGGLAVGFIRAHIIGWNVKQKEYVSKLGLPKRQDQLVAEFKANDFDHVIALIKRALTTIFYDTDNYTINTGEAEEEDSKALRTAGQQYHEAGRQEVLPEIYTRSFNAGLKGEGAGKAGEYKAAFSAAYGVDRETLEGWELRLPPSSKMDTEMIEEDVVDIASASTSQSTSQQTVPSWMTEVEMAQVTVATLADDVEMMAPSSTDEYFDEIMKEFETAINNLIRISNKYAMHLDEKGMFHTVSARIMNFQELAYNAKELRKEIEM